MNRDIPAFPSSVATGPMGDLYQGSDGMSLRDYFAGQALVGNIANPELMEVVTAGSILDGTALDRVAVNCYKLADAMLKAREAK